MLRRTLLAVLGGLLLIITVPGVASATVTGGNSLGYFTCDAHGTGDHTATWSCTIHDSSCDGIAVYAEYRYGNDRIQSGWSRGSSNSGGCGSNVYSTRSASWVSYIDYVDFRLCKVVNNAWDTCYDSTVRRDS